MRHNHFLIWTLLLGVLGGATAATARSGQEPLEVGAVLELRDALRTTQRSYAGLRSPIEARVTDPTFTTKMALYLANEEILSGNGFLEKALQENLIDRDDMDFVNITANESYWYSRYNLSWLLAKSRMGLHLVHGPYLTLKAIEREGKVFDQRVRGEMGVANRQVLLDQIIPIYLARTGFPKRFSDASPLMLEFASGSPFLPRKVDDDDNFEGTSNGQVDFEESYLTLRWNHDKMDETIDFGGVGQTLVKQVLWMEYFFKQKHMDGKLLGNDAEDGFRGSMLNLMAVSKMLLLKSALFYDGKELGGIDPFSYDPSQGLRYLPHLLRPRLIMAGDIPPRPESFHVKDRSSQLFDQASLLWGTSEYYYFSDPEVVDVYDEVFGESFPLDGSVMELKWHGLAHGLSDSLLRNLLAMHLHDSGTLASEWTPGEGTGPTVQLMDAGMAMIALANYASRVHGSPDLQSRASELLRAEADLLVSVQNADGSYPEAIDLTWQTPVGENGLLLSQGFAIRGLLRAFEELHDNRYRDAAGKALGFMNEHLWDEGVGIYRSAPKAEVTVYTPMNLGAALGALREWILVTQDRSEVVRYKRFHVQGLNSSGILLAEESDTGEVGFENPGAPADSDGDGLKWFGRAGHGRRGVAAVHASEVQIQTPLDGTPSPRLAAAHNTTPSSPLLTAGRALYLVNCAPCHGREGRGDGPAAASLNPKPRNHTDRTVMDKLTNDQIKETVRLGGSFKNMPQMPAFPDFKEEDLEALATFVRSLSRGTPEPTP